MKEDGAIIVGGKQIATTRQCCHCGGHFLSVKGSGTQRGFCTRCHSVTCGSELCDVCLPHEKQLEMMEKGIHA